MHILNFSTYYYSQRKLNKKFFTDICVLWSLYFNIHIFISLKILINKDIVPAAAQPIKSRLMA